MPAPRLAACAALAALALVPAAAQARTVTANNVSSPSGLITCWALKYEGPGLECSAPYLPDIGPLDTFLRLRPRGRTVIGERGDFPGFITTRVRLRYGDVWRRPGIRCRIRTSGLTCVNRSGHGFTMARGVLRRF